MTPPNKPSISPEDQELVSNLALDTLEAGQQKQVLDFLKQRGDYKEMVKNTSKSMREELAKEIAEHKKKSSDVPTIIESLIKKIFEDNRHKDTFESFQTSKGETFAGGYKGFYEKLVEEEGVDFEGDDDDKNNSIKLACWRAIKSAIDAVPKEKITRKACNEYAESMIRDYVVQMEDQAETLWVGTLNDADVSKLKIKTFEEWMSENGKKPDEVALNFNPQEIRDFTLNYSNAQTELKKFREGITGVPNEIAEHFTSEASRIENILADKPADAVKDLQTLATAFASVKTLNEYRGTVQGALKEVADLKGSVADFDASIETYIKTLDEDIDKMVKEYLQSKDASKLKPEEMKVKMEEIGKKVSALKSKASAPGSTLAGGAEGGAGTPAEGAEEKMDFAEIIKDPMAWLEKMAKDNWFIGAIFAFAGPTLAKLFGKKAEEGAEADKPGKEAEGAKSEKTNDEARGAPAGGAEATTMGVATGAVATGATEDEKARAAELAKLPLILDQIAFIRKELGFPDDINSFESLMKHLGNEYDPLPKGEGFRAEDLEKGDIVWMGGKDDPKFAVVIKTSPVTLNNFKDPNSSDGEILYSSVKDDVTYVGRKKKAPTAVAENPSPSNSEVGAGTMAEAELESGAGLESGSAAQEVETGGVSVENSAISPKSKIAPFVLNQYEKYPAVFTTNSMKERFGDRLDRVKPFILDKDPVTGGPLTFLGKPITGGMNMLALPYLMMVQDKIKKTNPDYRLRAPDVPGFSFRNMSIIGQGVKPLVNGRLNPNSPPSSHAYGMAVDLDGHFNGPNHGRGNIPDGVVRAFTESGFVWGLVGSEDFPMLGQDPMHFQLSQDPRTAQGQAILDTSAVGKQYWEKIRTLLPKSNDAS